MNGPDEHGWWAADEQSADAGIDYGFCIDDDPTAYPDPRSQWQPNGVHEMSRIYDMAQFSWTDKEFKALPLEDAVVYELHIGTFTPNGTLDSAIERLEYLADLGITHIELMPLATFPGNRGWGYDAVALFAVQQAYGGPDALKRFVNAAHQRGLAVLLDVVYNHFGPIGNYAAKFGPYLLDAHKTPWGCAVNLEDAGSHEVRRFFCDNALMWLRDFHLDGLRLDAVHAFIDRSAISFLEQLATEVAALSNEQGRHYTLIAESDLNDPRLVTPLDQSGIGFDAQWNDDFHHALFSVLNPGQAGGYYSDFGDLSHLAKALEKTFVYDGNYSIYRDRNHGRPVGNLNQCRFLAFIQNHDQVGNRAVGDRIRAVVGFERAKIAAAIVLTSPFVPMLFQGEEWAASSPFQYFAEHENPEMRRLVCEGRKTEFMAFGWDSDAIPDPEAQETFSRSQLHWDERNSGEHAEMLSWYQQLIRLRREIPALRNGQLGTTAVTYDEMKKTFIIRRGEFAILCNLSADTARFESQDFREVVLSSTDKKIESLQGSVTLPADTLVIMKG